MKLLKWIGLGVLSIIVLLTIWGVFIEPFQIEVNQEIATIPNLPDDWQGKQIAIISDFQLGMWGDNEKTVKMAVNHLVEIKPEVVLILGDFIYHAPVGNEDETQKAADILQPLTEAQIPIFAVLGNHDYQVNKVGDNPNLDLAMRLREKLNAIGVTVLQNEVVSLPSQNENNPLYVVGIGAHQPLLDEPVGTFLNIDVGAPRFVMMHNPASFENIPAGAAPVAVAGHTHGGQIRIPFTPEWSMLTYVQSEPVHTDGWIKDYGQPKNELYVNRGIGFSLIPVRINCRPEITLFTLTKQ